MGRKGDDAWVRQVIALIRDRVPDVFIRTTVIAGFPGESEQQYEQLCRFVDDMRFQRLGCFAYSQEEGTPAAKLDGQLDEETKRHRAQHIMDKQALIMGDYNRQMIGKTVQVMVDYFDSEDMAYVGRTQHDAPEIDGTVRFAAECDLQNGDLVAITVDEADDFDLYGHLAADDA